MSWFLPCGFQLEKERPLVRLSWWSKSCQKSGGFRTKYFRLPVQDLMPSAVLFFCLFLVFFQSQWPSLSFPFRVYIGFVSGSGDDLDNEMHVASFDKPRFLEESEHLLKMDSTSSAGLESSSSTPPLAAALSLSVLSLNSWCSHSKIAR